MALHNDDLIRDATQDCPIYLDVILRSVSLIKEWAGGATQPYIEFLKKNNYVDWRVCREMAEKWGLYFP